MKRVTAALLPLAALVLACPAALRAQSQQPSPPTFRSGTEIVRLDVRIVDESGRPVRDLRADEIEVIEEGHTRPVVLFQRLSDPGDALLDAARRTIGGEVSTNQGAPRGQLYILIFDQAHITPGNEQRARAAAARFLTTRVQPGDRVALYGIPGPGPQIDFTTNVAGVIAELSKIRGGLERFSYGAVGPMRIQEALEVTRGNQEVLNRVVERLSSERAGTDVLAGVGVNAPGAAGGGDPALFQMLVQEDARGMVARADQQARNFLLMFADVIRLLRLADGRKNVILFSEGFFADNISRELEQVAAAAAESYTVIHTLDLNRRQIDIREQEALGGDQFNEIQSRLGALGSLSAETDGTLMIDASAALDRSLARVAENSRDYYLVGFEPARREAGPYRRVRVRVTRPGVRVYARTGYAADFASATPTQRRRTIDAALRAPFPQQGLAVSYTTYVTRSPRAGMQKVFVSLAAELPVAGATEPRRADVVFVVRDAEDGRVAASGTDTVSLPRMTDPDSTTGTSQYHVQFEVPAGSYLMRAVVREPGGLMGSADRRFVVRQLDRAGVTFSDLILGGEHGRLPVRAVAHAGLGLAGTLELYGPQPEQLADVSVAMELTPLGGDRPQRVVYAALQDVRVADGVASRAAHLSTPLTGVPPGDYLVTAIVRAGGEQVGTATREVRIDAEAPPAPAETVELMTVNAAEVLEGRQARDYARELQAAAAGTTLDEAAAYAVAGAWPRVIAALPSGETNLSPAAAALRGLGRLGTGDYAGACADLRRAFDAGGQKDARAAFVLGWAHVGAGSEREAIGAWRAAVFLDPLMVPAHLALAEQFMRQDESALAIQALRAGLAAVPDSPELKNKLLIIEQQSARRTS